MLSCFRVEEIYETKEEREGRGSWERCWEQRQIQACTCLQELDRAVLVLLTHATEQSHPGLRQLLGHDQAVPEYEAWVVCGLPVFTRGDEERA